MGKRTLPAVKICEMCGKQWAPTTRYQAARNRTCSHECAKAMQSKAMAGKNVKPLEQREVTTLPCPVCGSVFTRPNSWLRKVRTPTCSNSCNGKLRVAALLKRGYRHEGPRGPIPALQGPNNPAWRGGVTLKRPKGNYTGVRYVRAPDWAKPMARKDGYIAEHRLVMAKRCGFLLTRTEVVHHLDHRPGHNSPRNLELWPDNASHKAAEHGKIAPGAANRWSPGDLAAP